MVFRCLDQCDRLIVRQCRMLYTNPCRFDSISEFFVLFCGDSQSAQDALAILLIGKVLGVLPVSPHGRDGHATSGFIWHNWYYVWPYSSLCVG